jgi:CRP-like cAMP-binding protein
MTIIEAGRMRSPEHRVALYLSRLFWRSTRRLNLTQEELGQLAGLSRQTVNRVLRALEAAGIVTLDFGRVAIVDDEALSAHLAATATA